MPIVNDGMGFFKSKKLSKLRKGVKGVRKGLVNRNTVSFGSRIGAAYVTGGASEKYRAQSRAMTSGNYNFLPNEGLNGIESLGEMAEVTEGMGRRGFKAIRRVASRAVKKVAAAPKIAKKLANVNTMLKVSTGGLVDKDALKEIGGGLTDFAKGFVSKKGGGGESAEPTEKIMAEARGGAFSWGSGGGGGGGGAFTEEVQEVNEETGKLEKITQMKPVVKYGLIGVGGLAALAVILKMLKK